MPIELTMPRLSDTMESGTIIKWNVKEGDKVSSGTAVADVETDKATMEMQAFDDGTLAKIVVPEGQMVPIGTVIALIAEPGEDPKQVAAGAKSANPPAAASAPAVARASSVASSSSASAPTATTVAETPRGSMPPPAAPNGVEGDAPDGARLRVSPVARRIADEHGLDVSTIHGSGPSGRVVKEDVLAAAAARGGGATPAAGDRRPATPAPSTGSTPVAGAAASAASASSTSSTSSPDAAPARLAARTIALSGMRQTIAKRLVESKTTIPHYQVTMRFDMEALLSLRTTLNEQLHSQGVKLSVNDFLVRACALAMHQHHEFNASWAGPEGVRVHGAVNIGVAIALPRERGGGLVVGVIRDADRKGLRQLSQEAKALGEKARGRGLGPEDLSDSTFTISNLGMFGVDHFTAIINPPNSAILAVGAALELPVVRKGQIVVGHEMSATLSLDHRVIDGVMAAAYLQTLKSLMENPATLLV